MPYGTTVGATGGSTTITAANLPSHTHTFSGTTSGQSAGHTHSISDPGHQHSYRLDVNGANVAFVGNQGNVGGPQLGEGTGPSGSISTATQSSTTGITGTQGVSNDHTHTFSGTTGATGSGDAFITPYLGISFIIKF